MTALDTATLEALDAGFLGELVRPDHPTYDDTRKIWNGHIDRRPALIARCRGVADVIAAVRFAREHDLAHRGPWRRARRRRPRTLR